MKSTFADRGAGTRRAVGNTTITATSSALIDNAVFAVKSGGEVPTKGFTVNYLKAP